MTTRDIAAKTQKLAERGIDARTITVNFELDLKRPLTAAEAQAVQDGWRASADARFERQKQRDLDTARQLQDAGSGG